MRNHTQRPKSPHTRKILAATSAGVLALAGFAPAAQASTTADELPQVEAENIATLPAEAPHVPAIPSGHQVFLNQEFTVGWDSYTQYTDTSITFSTQMGTPTCYGLRYEVQESADEVAVAIIQGSLRDEEQFCALEIHPTTMNVELDAPLGDRDVVELENPTLNTKPLNPPR